MIANIRFGLSPEEGTFNKTWGRDNFRQMFFKFVPAQDDNMYFYVQEEITIFKEDR